jgi:hypothetical protein
MKDVGESPDLEFTFIFEKHLLPVDFAGGMKNCDG